MKQRQAHVICSTFVEMPKVLVNMEAYTMDHM